MNQIQNSKPYDLEERTFQFAKECRDFIKKIPKNIANIEYGKQLIRSSGSQAANYIEANESLSKKDFILRLKIALKEVKESALWLKLIDINNEQKLFQVQQDLIKETFELRKIFHSIITKSS